MKGFVHITGGGFYDNIPRILPEGTAASIDNGSWPVLPIFNLIAEKGNIPQKDLFRTFNMGIGMIAIVAEKDVDAAMASLQAAGEQAYKIGRIVAGDRTVVISGVNE